MATNTRRPAHDPQRQQKPRARRRPAGWLAESLALAKKNSRTGGRRPRSKFPNRSSNTKRSSRTARESSPADSADWRQENNRFFFFRSCASGLPLSSGVAAVKSFVSSSGLEPENRRTPRVFLIPGTPLRCRTARFLLSPGAAGSFFSPGGGHP